MSRDRSHKSCPTTSGRKLNLYCGIFLSTYLLKHVLSPTGVSKRLLGGIIDCKNLNASRPSEHLPFRGEIVKTFRWYQQAHIIHLVTFVWRKTVPEHDRARTTLKKLERSELFVQLGTTVVALCIYLCNFRSPKNCPAWFCSSRSVQ